MTSILAENTEQLFGALPFGYFRYIFTLLNALLFMG